MEGVGTFIAGPLLPVLALGSAALPALGSTVLPALGSTAFAAVSSEVLLAGMAVLAVDAATVGATCSLWIDAVGSTAVGAGGVATSSELFGVRGPDFEGDVATISDVGVAAAARRLG